MNDLPPVNWDLTADVGGRFTRPGPKLSRQQKVDVIGDLQEISRVAHAHAVHVSQLPDPGEVIGVHVCGRAEWIARNTESIQAMLGDVLDARPHEELSLWGKVSSRGTGFAAGLALSWVATKIVGQFDPFATVPTLYYVAPNVVQIERELDVMPADFRLWVAVHEQTHRLQFFRAPWLGATLQQLAVQGLREGATPADPGHFLARATTLMSVLEGHAEVMMSAVGPDVIPSVETIRERFARRREKGGFDAVARRLLGMDHKLAQYRDGAAFCRHVLDVADLSTLNLVWSSEDTFPTPAELHAPADWLRRIGA